MTNEWVRRWYDPAYARFTAVTVSVTALAWLVGYPGVVALTGLAAVTIAAMVWAVYRQEMRWRTEE